MRVCDYVRPKHRVKPRLLQRIMIKLTNKVRAAMKFRTINTWNEVQETFKNSLKPKRTITHYT